MLYLHVVLFKVLLLMLLPPLYYPLFACVSAPVLLLGYFIGFIQCLLLWAQSRWSTRECVQYLYSYLKHMHTHLQPCSVRFGYLLHVWRLWCYLPINWHFCKHTLFFFSNLLHIQCNDKWYNVRYETMCNGKCETVFVLLDCIFSLQYVCQYVLWQYMFTTTLKFIVASLDHNCVLCLLTKISREV